MRGTALDERAEKWYTSSVDPFTVSSMFPGNETPNDGFSGNPFSGSDRGTPPPGDAIFESAFEELDGSSLDDELLAAAEAADERRHAFLTVGLHFFEHLNGMKRA
jgi:hypothetical protein